MGNPVATMLAATTVVATKMAMQRPRKVLVLGPLTEVMERGGQLEVAEVSADAIDALSRLRPGGSRVGYEALVVSGMDEHAASEFISDAMRLDGNAAIIVHGPEFGEETAARLIRAGAFDVWREALDSVTGFAERTRRAW